MARKKRLTIAEQRQQLADAGDVEGIWQIISTANPIMVDWEELFQLLLRAMIIRSRTEPERFSAEMLSRMFALTSFLTLRTHHHIARLIARYDRSDCGGSADLPREFDTILPRLIELQRHLGEIAHHQAGVCRLWELARGRRMENDRTNDSAQRPCRCGAIPGPVVVGVLEGGGCADQEEDCSAPETLDTAPRECNFTRREVEPAPAED